ncbi:MAG: hypothetical protein GY795_42590, partial [Desulfobacterales bacterium]|nr:hypothetical protein [Desulfobacterales bacterium]
MRFFFRYIFIFFTLSLPNIIHAQDGGSALKFDGINDYVKIENSPSLTPSDFTLEGWFNFSSIPSGHAHMLGKTLGTATLESYTIFYKYGNLHGLISDKNGYGPWLTYEWDIKAGTWYHIAYTFDDTKNVQALYINGELADSGTVAKSVEYDSHPVLIGANHENENLEYFFPGQIKETRIWNVARTQEEIQADMNKVLSENENGLAGYWRFNEGQGQTASDSSANDNHGQLGSSPENDDSDPIWVVHVANGHFYEVFTDTEVTWHQAKAIAEDMGGYLATITSAEEQQFIEDLLISSGAPTGAYWFGLVETGTEGIYTWDNGESLSSYTNWCDGEPNNGWGGESVGNILWTVEPDAPLNTFARRGEWNDLRSEGWEGVNYRDLNRGGYIVESQPTECIEDDSGSIDITGKSGPCVGKLTIPVRIQNAPNAANSLGFDVAFDSNVLTYTGFARGPLAEQFDFFNVTEVPGGLV